MKKLTETMEQALQTLSQAMTYDDIEGYRPSTWTALYNRGLIAWNAISGATGWYLTQKGEKIITELN